MSAEAREKAQQIVELAERPAEVTTGEWDAAARELAYMAVDLARLVLAEADEEDRRHSPLAAPSSDD